MVKDVEIKSPFKGFRRQKGQELLKVLGVEYIHLKLANGDDLYITQYGWPFLELLMPENYWLDKEWYNNNSLKLEGTSSVFKVRSKTINKKHKEFVLKWNRMGQDIPGVEDNNELINASFNSPFEEFSLVMELREALKTAKQRVAIQKPLAIYVPKAQIELNRLGRKEYKIDQTISAHHDIALDKYRSYAVIYEWLKGLDTVSAYAKKVLAQDKLEVLTMEGESRLNDVGFTVLDRKPHHVIVRYESGNELLRDKTGKIVFGLVDYELLERLPHHDKLVKKIRRKEYLKRQKDRFKKTESQEYPPHLTQVNILGVDYVYGHVESTDGRLWVVGKDPYLFDYFLPERWKHTPKNKLSKSSEMYHTATKDNIHVVWKISNVGLQPEMDPFKEDERKALKHGFNSPFEECALAMELSENGLTTIYPRAIYMKGKDRKDVDLCVDDSRYKSHQDILTPEGEPVLIKQREYIIIWGYWNGPDEKLATEDNDYYRGIDILKAYKDKLISEEQYFSFLNKIRTMLHDSGYEDLNLRGNHVMLSLDSNGKIVIDQAGEPELRVCNFELLKKL